MSELINIKIGITIGDINGIGPEVILKSLNDNRILDRITPIIYGSDKALNHYIKTLNLDNSQPLVITSAEKAKTNHINVINVVKKEVNISEGKEDIEAGKVAIQALERATEDISNGNIDAIVTAPISKSVCQNAGFDFPGHTEYFSSLSNGNEGLMILSSSIMKIALVTTHISLKEVSEKINKQLIIDKATTFSNSLKKDFGMLNPKLAILSLNPHCGENGKMGNEEIEIIFPAIKELKEKGILAFGPFPTDGFFGSESRKNYDGVLSMYHDQGLSVFKALSFDEGVNFTSGLPIVRTSPDHGTAFDICGKGEASETSMRNAIYLAIDIYRSRIRFKENMRNPLEFKKETKEHKTNVKPKVLKKN
jgi:4-hydroxythreonine-4-phosphate dehydrogenase